MRRSMQSLHQFTGSLWDEFRRVDPADVAAVRAFSVRWRFHLPTRDPRRPYIGVDSSHGMRRFRWWHRDFSRNVMPTGFEYQALMLKIADKGKNASAALLEDARDAAEALTAASTDYLGQLSPFLRPSPGIPQVEILYAARDLRGGPHVRPFDAGSAVGIPGKAELTLTSVGHVFIDFVDDVLRGVSDRLPFLPCASCGHRFLVTAAQLAHREQGNKTYCPACQMPRDEFADSPTYRRIYMRDYMRRRRAKEKGGSG